jgi:hypothetical protein
MFLRKCEVLAAVCALALLAGLVGAPGQALGAMYVVDQAAPGAADTNAGTEEKPFKTVQHAADLVKPGDTVYVMAGKYDERVKVKTSGAAGQPITLRAMPRRSATVAGFDLEASYIRVEGFEIIADKPVVGVQLGGSHCEVVDNSIRNMMIGVAGTYGKRSAADPNWMDYSAVSHTRIAYNKVYHSDFGFLLNGEDWLVENNEVSRLFMYMDPNRQHSDCDYTRFFGKGCVQRYNYYHGTISPQESKAAHVDGIQTFGGGGALDVLIEYNAIFDWGQGCMVESGNNNGSVRNWTFRYNLYSSKTPQYHGAWGLDIIKAQDVTIEHNTFASITWCGVGLRGKESTGGKILSNLFYDSERAVLESEKDFPPANPVIENNLTFKTAPIAAPKNTNGQDPLFVDAEKRDFRLRAGSPAIGAGQDGAALGALEYPNVYYVDPRHPAAADEPAWGYPAVPLSSLAKACAIAQPGETILLRGGVYREVLAPRYDGVTVRAMPGEKVTLSGADLIEGWKREADGTWSATLAAEPKKILRDGQPWSEFSYDKAATQISVKAGGDPRLHVFETVLRKQGIDLAGRKDTKIEAITAVDILGAGAANP